ncbi:hypothetical protein [Paenibacillus illinoisensis]|uniref:hypothetical protein n=1 Tax=Paenibacillus illinoisensis TaxID=59845 RepID=UPI001C8CFE05|nr:hypothetical protein [Paenibacillus illinoisensis]MBY0217961.1 hypothetical protein [Paenibacillus illinoisensis]
MIVEIDGYFENVLIIGKACSISELKMKYKIAKTRCTDISKFADIFCGMFQFERLPPPHEIDVRPEVVIDTDTDRNYAPRH